MKEIHWTELYQSFEAYLKEKNVMVCFSIGMAGFDFLDGNEGIKFTKELAEYINIQLKK
jgi:predicted protein tyrosine phosphatase